MGTMSGSAGSLSLAGALLVRTLAQFAALRRCRPKLKMSFRAIEAWQQTQQHSACALKQGLLPDGEMLAVRTTCGRLA